MKKITLIFLSVFSVFFVACAAKEDSAVVVNGTHIAKTTYEATLQNIVSAHQQLGQPDILENAQNRQLLGHLALQQLITNEVLAQEAQKQNIKIEKKLIEQNIDNLKKAVIRDENGQPIADKKVLDQKFKEKLKKDGTTLRALENNIRKELLAKTLLKDYADKQKIELQEQGLQNFYDQIMIVLGNDQKQKESLPKENLPLLVPFATEVKKQTAERALVSSVFLATPKDISKQDLSAKQQQARDIIKELKENKISFAEAIEKYSDDKNALKTNGEQLVLRGTLPTELDKAVFESKLGTITGPLTQPEGVYIIRVNEKRAEIKPTYTQLRNSIINTLAEAQLKQKTSQYVQELVNNAKVEILVPELAQQSTPAEK